MGYALAYTFTLIGHAGGLTSEFTVTPSFTVLGSGIAVCRWATSLQSSQAAVPSSSVSSSWRRSFRAWSCGRGIQWVEWQETQHIHTCYRIMSNRNAHTHTHTCMHTWIHITHTHFCSNNLRHHVRSLQQSTYHWIDWITVCLCWMNTVLFISWQCIVAFPVRDTLL